jgi:hypothetical protein
LNGGVEAGWGKDAALRTTLALFILLAGNTAVHASAELRVFYDAQLKPLRRALHVGDPLDISLYDNPACEGQPIHAEILGAGTLRVSVEVVEPLAAKGERPKPAAIARIRATTGVDTVGTQLYLRVTGEGIEPAGPECQPQVSAVVGTPGPQGPEGPPGPVASRLKYFDRNDNPIGLVIDISRVFVESVQAPAVIKKNDGMLQGSGGVFFESEDCLGGPLGPITGDGRLLQAGERWFLCSTAAIPSDVEIGSLLGGSGACTAHPNIETVVPCDEIFPVGPGFTTPFPLPIHIGPSVDD